MFSGLLRYLTLMLGTYAMATKAKSLRERHAVVPGSVGKVKRSNALTARSPS
jgi:hypothetical protein